MKNSVLTFSRSLSLPLPLSLSLILLLQACVNTPDLEAEKKNILALHNQQRKAHLEKNVNLLLGDSLHWDYIEVNRGKVRRPTYSESYNRFKSYFESVDFIKWDDVSEPVISFSDDATMATSIVEKMVITKSTSEIHQIDTAYYSWLAVFKKKDGTWSLHRMGSTNR